MSSLTRIESSRTNGARSRGPVTKAGKLRSSQNAVTHGLLARCTLLQDESPEALDALLQQHLERLGPTDGVELGMVEEMVASYWRLRRAWALETRMFEKEVSAQEPGDRLDRMAAAFENLAGKHSLGLMHRYQTRLHLAYQRALHSLLLLRTAVPNEPTSRPKFVGRAPTPAPDPPVRQDAASGSCVPNEPRSA